MYDSRSSHPRHGAHKERSWCGKSTGGVRMVLTASKHGDFTPKHMRQLTDAEAIAEHLLDMEPDVDHRPVFTSAYLNRLHAQAWIEDARRMDDLADEAWAWLAEHDQERAEDIDDDDEGYPEPWMWTLTMTEAREHFGPDFEHNGFQIDSTNRPRRVTTMKDTETMRLQAIEASRAQRERHEKLAAQLYPDGKAKVTRPRPLPVSHAERPEPTPYEKYAGVYNEALDPISPNFAMGSWGGE